MHYLNWDNTGVTVELGELVQNGVDIWAFEYPSYYEGDKKKAFEQKVIDHYRFRQIAQETPGRWLHYFRTRIREIMPYYIQLYKFQEHVDAIDNPLESYNLIEEYEREHSSTGKMTGTTSDESSVTGSEEGFTSGSNAKNNSAESTRRFSNTPQGAIENIDDYLSEATKEDQTSTETGTESSENSSSTSSTATSSGSSGQDSENAGTEKYTLSRRGNIGVQPLGTEVENIRHSFINIDMMVINELKDLFLQVY